MIRSLLLFGVHPGRCQFRKAAGERGAQPRWRQRSFIWFTWQISLREEARFDRRAVPRRAPAAPHRRVSRVIPRAKRVSSPDAMAREAAAAIAARELTLLGARTELGGADVPELQMPEVEMKARFIRYIERTQRRSILSTGNVGPDGKRG